MLSHFFKRFSTGCGVSATCVRNMKLKLYVYGSMHHNIFYEITNRCSYMQSILFHC